MRKAAAQNTGSDPKTKLMKRFIFSAQQNYYFKESIAYTEDHIPVKKIYLYKVPPEVPRPLLSINHELIIPPFAVESKCLGGALQCVRSSGAHANFPAQKRSTWMHLSQSPSIHTNWLCILRQCQRCSKVCVSLWKRSCHY